MASWKKTIATHFRRTASTLFSQQQPKDKQSQPGNETGKMMMTMDLQGEVMACGYEDVRVMWSILDKAMSCGHETSF